MLPYQPWDKPIERFFSTVCSKFSKWFESYTGTLTGSKTYAKRQKRYGEPEEEQAQPGFEEQLLERETAWEVHKLLHQLDEPYREVFSLRVLGELSFSQIGQLFGKSDSWARLIFYRAKTELRRRADENQL